MSKSANRIDIKQGDITTIVADAIVNAANPKLLGGGGVDGAIHRAAGPKLLEECRTLNGCPTGEARITDGHDLPAKKVIHTVGPVWRDGDHGEPELLANCYRSVLSIATSAGIPSVAFPSIGTGVYGYPIEKACRIALTETLEHLAEHDHPHTVMFVCFSAADRDCYVRASEELSER